MPAGPELCQHIIAVLTKTPRVTVAQIRKELPNDVSERAIRYALKSLMADRKVSTARNKTRRCNHFWLRPAV